MTHENMIGIFWILMLMFVVPIILYVMVEWCHRRPDKSVQQRREERIEKGKDKLNDLFNENSAFCPVCLTHESFWTGGGSWSPDRCSYHRNSDDAILWKNMTREQKKIAAEKMDNKWWQKFGVYYFNKRQRKMYDY